MYIYSIDIIYLFTYIYFTILIYTQKIRTGCIYYILVGYLGFNLPKGFKGFILRSRQPPLMKSRVGLP